MPIAILEEQGLTGNLPNHSDTLARGEMFYPGALILSV
jgi:hypothetical protein